MSKPSSNFFLAHESLKSAQFHLQNALEHAVANENAAYFKAFSDARGLEYRKAILLTQAIRFALDGVSAASIEPPVQPPAADSSVQLELNFVVVKHDLKPMPAGGRLIGDKLPPCPYTPTRSNRT